MKLSIDPLLALFSPWIEEDKLVLSRAALQLTFDFCFRFNEHVERQVVVIAREFKADIALQFKQASEAALPSIGST